MFSAGMINYKDIERIELDPNDKDYEKKKNIKENLLLALGVKKQLKVKEND